MLLGTCSVQKPRASLCAILTELSIQGSATEAQVLSGQALVTPRRLQDAQDVAPLHFLERGHLREIIARHQHMPGLEVLRALRDRNYSGGVIIMTGSHNEELLREAWSLGPQEILMKPVDLELFLTAIQLVLVCREC